MVLNENMNNPKVFTIGENFPTLNWKKRELTDQERLFYVKANQNTIRFIWMLVEKIPSHELEGLKKLGLKTLHYQIRCSGSNP